MNGLSFCVYYSLIVNEVVVLCMGGLGRLGGVVRKLYHINSLVYSIFKRFVYYSA